MSVSFFDVRQIRVKTIGQFNMRLNATEINYEPTITEHYTSVLASRGLVWYFGPLVYLHTAHLSGIIPSTYVFATGLISTSQEPLFML